MKYTMRILIGILCTVLCLHAMLAFSTPMQAHAAESAAASNAVYKEHFDYQGFQAPSLFDTPVWVPENPSSGNNVGFSAACPVLANGVMKLEKGQSAQFNWTQLENFCFDPAATYTLTFEVTVTDFGDDTGIHQGWKRELYFAAGGYYNQIELRSDRTDTCIRTGDTYLGNAHTEYCEGVTYTACVIWSPAEARVTSSLSRNRQVIANGSRRLPDIFANADAHMSNWVFRCEDGAIEIDNLSFTDGTNTYVQNFESAHEGDYLTDTCLWRTESKERPNATAPTVRNGMLYLKDTNSVAFDWMRTAGGLTFDAQNSYTFTFDLWVNDAGDGSYWDYEHLTRALYVAWAGIII